MSVQIHATSNCVRVLVADDHAGSRRLMQIMFEMMGHEVSIACDGAECIEIARSWRPQIVFMDIGMPRINGYEACKQIRAEVWGKELPLVALTGWGSEEDRQMALQAGFNHHMVKPINPEMLAEVIATLSAPAK